MEHAVAGTRPGAPAMPTLYELLRVEPDADADTIAVAYRRQRGLYELSEAEAQDPAFVRVAEERCGALDDAFAVLSDPQQRVVYDRSIGLTGRAAPERRGVSAREVLYALGGVLAGVLILGALWSALGRDATPNAAVSEVSYAAPPINLRMLDGGQFDLEQYRGKVVLVNFWGTWCLPCREETPALQVAYERLADKGLVIVGVDLFNIEKKGGIPDAEAKAKVRAFTDQYGVTYPMVLDETGSVAKDYKIYPIPVSYFIDREGTVRFIRIGGLTTKDVEELFGKLS